MGDRGTGRCRRRGSDRCDRGTPATGPGRSCGRRGQAPVAQRSRSSTSSATTPEERKKSVFGCPADDVACEGGGGLQVYTTIDLELQKKANEILAAWLPLPPYEENLAKCREILPNETDEFLARYAETHSCVPTGAMTMTDNWTGAVKVMASGLPFEFSQFDLAVQGRRNPGSSFKPFGLIAALENGYTMGHSWSGKSPIKIECPFPCAPNGSNIWTVRNAGASFGVIDLAAGHVQLGRMPSTPSCRSKSARRRWSTSPSGWASTSRRSTRCSPSSSAARR